MNRKPQGVVSYAGLDGSTLLAGARLMFAGEGEENPCRLSALMPLFPVELIQSMPFVGVAQPGQAVAPGGFSIDPAAYHCMLRAEMPRLYTGDNLTRNLDGEGNFHGHGIVTVDEAWTTCFPQYQPYAGERLTIYPLGGGAQCAAVPESLYPKAAGLLRNAETALGITRRCHDYAHYVYQRIRAGEAFDADVFETEYLALRELSPVSLSQRDLGRLMQDLSMLQSVRDGSGGEGLYTEDAKRAEHLHQYVPGLYACDVFEELPQSRRTARLLQPMWEEGFVSDWWICCQDAAAYVQKERQTIDMAALCQGFQLAPVYDPITRGGRYPERVRIVSLKDKELRLRTAEVINNPAYGSGMNPQSAINRLVYLPGSRELLRQGKLSQEEETYRCENTAVSPADFRQMAAMSLLQERKGRLVDALYRRESVMSGVHEVSPEYAQLREMMNRPVEAVESGLLHWEKAQLSGYDADLDYLRRMGMEREWKPLPNKRKTFRFAPDALRQASIESGFAMRSACLRYDWAALAADASAGTAPEAAACYPDALPGDAARPAPDADALPDADGTGNAPEEQPLWLNAADPCCLTTDAGGRYPTDEELAQTGAVPPMPGSPAAPAPEEEKPAKAKKKTGGKKSKKGGKKAAKKEDKGNAPFTQEELMERQVPMTLPDPLPDEVGMAGEEAAAPAAAVGDMTANTDPAANAAPGEAAANTADTAPAADAEPAADTDPAANAATGEAAANTADTAPAADAEPAANTDPAANAATGEAAANTADTAPAADAEPAANTDPAANAATGEAAANAADTAPAADAESAADTDPAANAAPGEATANAAPSPDDPEPDPDPSLQQLKNGQLSFRFDELS